MSSNPYFRKPPPQVGKAQHKVLVKQPAPGKPAPKPGHHAQGGAHIDTVTSDSGQQQQLQDKGGA